MALYTLKYQQLLFAPNSLLTTLVDSDVANTSVHLIIIKRNADIEPTKQILNGHVLVIQVATSTTTAAHCYLQWPHPLSATISIFINR